MTHKLVSISEEDVERLRELAARGALPKTADDVRIAALATAIVARFDSAPEGEGERLRNALREANAHIGLEPSNSTEAEIRRVIEAALSPPTEKGGSK